jgi:hypothetical protein
LFGGEGNDTFVLSPGDARVGLFLDNSDTMDFTSGEDKIEVGHTIAAADYNVNVSTPGTNNLINDLTAALGPGANNLHLFGAARVDISSGTDAGTYVVVDNRGLAGYQWFLDDVMKLVDPIQSPQNTDFIV